MISIILAHAYCKEDISLIENYEQAINDKDNKWECHHRLEVHNDYQNTKDEMIMMNLYYNRPASELIFLTKSDHQKLHMNNLPTSYRIKMSKSCKGKKQSEEAKRKIAEFRRGFKFSEEARLKMSRSKLGMKYNTKNKKRDD